jgi:hypothetical protein
MSVWAPHPGLFASLAFRVVRAAIRAVLVVSVALRSIPIGAIHVV